MADAEQREYTVYSVNITGALSVRSLDRECAFDDARDRVNQMAHVGLRAPMTGKLIGTSGGLESFQGAKVVE